MQVLTIWGLIPIGAFPFDDDEDEDTDDDAWRRLHGLNERNEFPSWQPEAREWQ